MMHAPSGAGDSNHLWFCGVQAAQMAKLDAVIAAADIQSTDHVLEVGCGWGSFAMRAASTTGCR
jgi:cyclopropane-fatty-acyl-phospholipid synthase